MSSAGRRVSGPGRSSATPAGTGSAVPSNIVISNYSCMFPRLQSPKSVTLTRVKNVLPGPVKPVGPRGLVAKAREVESEALRLSS